MGAWFLSSSIVQGGTETCVSVCVHVAGNNCVCWSRSATPYKE